MSDYLLLILLAARVTIAVSVASLAFAIVLGFFGALAKLSANPFLKALATVYTTVIRGVPDLILMLLIYYGGTIGLNSLFEYFGSETVVDLDPFTSGVLTLGFIYGAYMTETFRGAILSVPNGQREAGLAFGMSPTRVFIRIIMPQMVRYAIPGFTNNWLVLIKATALVSVIGLQEMTLIAKQATKATREPFMYFLFSGALFLVITFVSLALIKWVGKRYSLGTRRGAL